jgi:putative membrane protein
MLPSATRSISDAAMTLLSGPALAEDAKLTDPQIAHTAYNADVIDITTGKQAMTTANNNDVKAFAEDMVRDHDAVNKQALDLVKKLNVTPEDNDTNKALSKQAADKLAELAKLSGAAFDKAYIANEVAYHEAANSALETPSIPSASNASTGRSRKREGMADWHTDLQTGVLRTLLPEESGVKGPSVFGDHGSNP